MSEQRGLIGPETGPMVVLGAAAALIVGSFLPWARLTAPLIGSVTKSGMDGGDGILTLIGGALIGLAGLAMLNRHSGHYVVAVVAALLLVLVVYEFIDIRDRFASLDSDSVAATYGAGLYLVGFGAVAAIVGTLLAD